MIERSAWAPIQADVVTPVKLLKKPRRLFPANKYMIGLERQDNKDVYYVDSRSIVVARDIDSGEEFDAGYWLKSLLDHCE
jgi:hypothetical protein